MYLKEFKRSVPSVPNLEENTKTNNLTPRTQNPELVVKSQDKTASSLINQGRIEAYDTEPMHVEAHGNQLTALTAEKMRECGFRAIPYVDSSGKHVIDKCNVHGARIKVTHAMIDA